MDDPSGRPPVGGVARRRRERRLRAQLRHEQQTVRMVLATVTHHSFQVGTAHDGLRAQKTVTSTKEVEERVPHAGLRAQKAPPPGMRSGVLQDPAPQGRVGQHSGIGYELVLALDVPVLQTVEQPVDASALAFLEEIEANDLEDEFMKLVHAGFHKSSALTERMREVVQRREVLRQKGRGRKKKKRRKRRTPRTSSLPSRRPCRVSLRHVVDVPVVRFSCNDEICADIYIYFRFKLNGKGRSEQWEVFLYCDKTIKVDRVSAEVLPWGVPLPDIGGVGFGSSPNLDTKHTIYELCLPSERVSLSCGGGFCSPDGAYDSVWDRVQPMTGKFAFNSFQYQGFVRCICMLNYWFSSNDEIYADNYNYSRFKLEDMCRCENWELYLCGVMTIKVDRDSVEVLPWGVPPLWFFTQLGNGSHTIHVLCLPSESGMGMSIFLAVPVSSGKYSGTSCRDVLHATLTGSTIDATALVVSTCSASADCTVSAAPMCSAGACVALSCDGGSSSDGAFGSLWGALPMKGITPSFTSSTKRTLGASSCSMAGSAATTEFAPTTTTASSSS